MESDRIRKRIWYECYSVYRMYVKVWQRWAQSRLRSLKLGGYLDNGFEVLVPGAEVCRSRSTGVDSGRS